MIDPLIRAWRRLKPVREVAPTTPTDLLHQVAESLETNYAACIGNMEERLAESRSVFDATVAELSERLFGLENDLQEREVTLQVLEQDRSELVGQLEDRKQALGEQQQSNARLQSDNDSLRGQVTRLEAEHKEAVERLRAEAREQVRHHEEERSRLTKEHRAELAEQRQALTEAAEMAEDRLMKMLDRERQQARQSTELLAGQLSESRDKAQVHREKAIALEASLRQLAEQNRTLSDELAEQEEDRAQLTEALESERERSVALHREYEAYREEHKIGGELAELQATIKTLQEKMG